MILLNNSKKQDAQRCIQSSLFFARAHSEFRTVMQGARHGQQHLLREATSQFNVLCALIGLHCNGTKGNKYFRRRECSLWLLLLFLLLTVPHRLCVERFWHPIQLSVIVTHGGARGTICCLTMTYVRVAQRPARFLVLDSASLDRKGGRLCSMQESCSSSCRHATDAPR